ncbi:hypothetical protein PMI41_03165 [Phyllobacterium sp. YR531]|nr:hypothetical protein PMI41_03165 [Phyllobacterium sp. YR531]
MIAWSHGVQGVGTDATLYLPHGEPRRTTHTVDAVG